MNRRSKFSNALRRMVHGLGHTRAQAGGQAGGRVSAGVGKTQLWSSSVSSYSLNARFRGTVSDCASVLEKLCVMLIVDRFVRVPNSASFWRRASTSGFKILFFCLQFREIRGS